MKNGPSGLLALVPRGLALVLLGAPTTLAQDESLYVPMEDGTRLAVDVHYPDDTVHEPPYPALLELTRYGRSRVNARTGVGIDPLNGLDRALLERGYALVKVDVRGTGASFGGRSSEYGREEVRDGYDLVDWLANEPWCDGNVGAFGTSYSGTTAELLTAVGHPALRAVVPGWSDFDLYCSPARPYGLLAKVVTDWGELVARMDRDDPSLVGATVRPVDEDVEGELLAAAIEEHAGNVDVSAAVRDGEFRDDAFVEGGDAYEQVSPLWWRDEIQSSGVPMLVLASWLDAGTADGALRRLAHFSNPQKLVLLASNHGGGAHASPFTVHDRPRQPVPDSAAQAGMRIDFFDHHLLGVDNGVEDWPTVRYFNLGEEAMLSTDVWPPPGTERRRYHFRSEGGLSVEPPDEVRASDTYRVDFGVTTGTQTRWSTQLGGLVLGLGDRGQMDERMLTYTSEPLEAALQVTGTPVVTLHLSSTASDGAVLVYLEDVAPDGRSRYVTEGGLRLLHRKLAPSPYGDPHLPHHSFRRADAAPLVPGEEVEVVFQLWPTSVRFEAGHRIRIAIAGADADNLVRVPAQGTPSLEVSRSSSRPSFVELPVVTPR